MKTKLSNSFIFLIDLVGNTSLTNRVLLKLLTSISEESNYAKTF